MARSAPPDRRTDKIRHGARLWALRMADDPERHRRAFDAWLAKDPAHGEAYQSLSRTLDAAALSAAKPDFPRQSVAAAAPRPRHAKLALPIAAALAVVVAVPVILLTRDDPVQREAPEPAIHAIIASAADGRTIRAADGSTLTLAPNSMVALRYDRRRRSVELLQGGARFAVAHDSARRFVVAAGGGTITALGTVFEVELDGEVEVRLLKGAVDVSVPRAERPEIGARQLRLAPGESTRFSASATRTSAVARSPGDVPDGLSFDNVPLAAVFAELNRGSPSRLVLGDPSLATRRVFLDLRDDDPTHAAAKLSALFDLEADPSTAGMIVLRPRKNK